MIIVCSVAWLQLGFRKAACMYHERHQLILCEPAGIAQAWTLSNPSLSLLLSREACTDATSAALLLWGRHCHTKALDHLHGDLHM